MPFFFFAVFLTLFLGQTADAASPMTVTEAVRVALENSPAFDTAKRAQLISDLTYKNTRSLLLPSLDFSTTDGLQNNIPIASTTGPSVFSTNPTAPWSAPPSLGLTENLYDNGVTLTNLSIAEMNKKIADENFKKTRDSLVLNVAQQFYQFSLASMLLDVRKQQQELLDKQFKVLTSQYLQGFKEKIDYLRFKTQLQQAQIDRITAENSMTQSIVQLRDLLGVSFRDQQPPDFVPVSVERQRKMDALVQANAPKVEGFYDYRITQLQEEVNSKTSLLVKRKYWPQIGLSSAVTYSNQNYINSDAPFAAGHQLSWNALLTLQYNIWDWGSRARDVEIAEANQMIQENALNQNLIDVNSKMTGLMSDMKRVGLNYQLSQDLLSLEEESNQKLEEQYRDGKVTYLDLITGFNNLLAAKVQFYTAYFDALQNIAQYQFYNGKIYESILETPVQK